MSTTLADTDVLAHYARTGDPAAFATLLTRYRQMVFATCMRVLHHEPDAEDASQETFYKFARQAATIKGNAAAWLHACAHGTAIDFLRARGSQRRAEAVAATPTDAVDPASHTWREVEPLLDAALAQLSDEDRDAIVAHYLAGRPQRDLAREAKVSPGTMSRRIERALNTLATHLRTQGVTTTTLTATSLAGVLGLALHSAPSTAAASSFAKIALADAAMTGKRTAVASLLSVKSVAIVSVATTALAAGGLFLAFQQPTPTPKLQAPATLASGIVPRPTKTSPLYYLADMTTDGELASSFKLVIDAAKITFTSRRSADDPEQVVIMERLSTTTEGDTTTVRVKIATIESLGNDPFIHALGRQATFKAVGSNDRLTLTLEVDDMKTNLDPMLVRRIKPVDPAAAEPILGTWGQVANWQLELSENAIRIVVPRNFTLQQFRILNWEESESEGCSKLEVICTDCATDVGAIGRRFKMLLRKDTEGYTLAHHEFLSKKAGTWPTFTPKKGDDVRLLTFTKEQP